MLPVLAWVGAAVVVLVLLDRLVPQAARAILGEDECFHAHIAQWIAERGRLPERIPAFYGGLFYSYPPLLHGAGAAWVRLLGPQSLPLLNVVLYALVWCALVAVPVPGLTRTARRWALWLVIANVALASYAVRFYAEMLACLLGLVVAMLFLRLAATRRVRDGILLGIAGGLALLAKNTALVVVALLVAFVLAQAAARRRDGVWAGIVALALALALAAPMLIRNQALFGSPIYPGFARDVDPWLSGLNRERFGRDLVPYLWDVWVTLGPQVLIWGAVAALVALARRRRDASAGLLACSLGGIALALLSPQHEARHVMPVIAIMALTGAMVLHDALRARPPAVAAVECGLAVLTLVMVLNVGDRRTPFDAQPRLMRAYAAIRERVPADETVLSLWTYETAYHSGRPATWPIPWGQGARSPAVLFREEDPDRFLAELDRLGIGWLLMPEAPGAERFDSANYPRSMMACVSALTQRGALRVAWRSAGLVLVGRVH